MKYKVFHSVTESSAHKLDSISPKDARFQVLQAQQQTVNNMPALFFDLYWLNSIGKIAECGPAKPAPRCRIYIA